MLQQEINLYKGFVAPITSSSYLTWKRYWILNGIFTIILLIVYFASTMQNVYLHRESDKLQQQLASNKKEFEQLKSSFPQLFFSENIGDSVAGVKKRMDSQAKILKILSSNSPFSDILRALSQAIVQNVWLSTITIKNSGEQIILNGNSLGLARINDYLASIENEKIFASYKVAINEVKNNETLDPTVKSTFTINMDKIKNE